MGEDESQFMMDVQDSKFAKIRTITVRTNYSPPKNINYRNVFIIYQMIVKASEKENGQVIETQVSLQCKPIYPGLITKTRTFYVLKLRIEHFNSSVALILSSTVFSSFSTPRSI